MRFQYRFIRFARSGLLLQQKMKAELPLRAVTSTPVRQGDVTHIKVFPDFGARIQTPTVSNRRGRRGEEAQMRTYTRQRYRFSESFSVQAFAVIFAT